jgi:hypothetical protein
MRRARVHPAPLFRRQAAPAAVALLDSGPLPVAVLGGFTDLVLFPTVARLASMLSAGEIRAPRASRSTTAGRA